MWYILQGIGAFALCAGIAGLLFYLWYCIDYVIEIRREMNNGFRFLRQELDVARKECWELRALICNQSPGPVKNVDKKDKSEEHSFGDEFGKCD